MANERLRAAIFSSQFDLDDVAHQLGVDRKTVERWLSGRLPYKRHRYALAALLGVGLRVFPITELTRCRFAAASTATFTGEHCDRSFAH